MHRRSNSASIALPSTREHVVSRTLAGRVIRNRVSTHHAHISLVEATLALFAAAFDGGDNQCFILVSESTIPITSFVNIRDDLARCGARSLIRYSVPPPNAEHHQRLNMVINGLPFAKAFYHHDQWVVLQRRHVEPLLDRSYPPLFARLFAADEHDIMNVLVHMKGVSQDELINRRTIFVNWQEKEIKLYVHPGTGQIIECTYHPKTYTNLTPSDLDIAQGA